MNTVSMCIILNNEYFRCSFSIEFTCAFLLKKNLFELSESNTFKPIENDNIKGAVVNRAMQSFHGRSLKIMLTVPLRTLNSVNNWRNCFQKCLSLSLKGNVI